ncbi:SMI1/KNR4 family protein [Streptacidiphilus sp. EB129]|jgi:cell wall assembly regulator SMI1|uniref:SMI1/KNR4 family protein n=1 Tax=Streptacidiphilus sp. EB129 TaxID=3156262 RepID=UPI0035136DAE
MSPAASTIRASWSRIDAWLLTHAPASYALLAPPADPHEVEAAQAEMGVRFPLDLVESLACHDGLLAWANMFPSKPPLPVAQILAYWRMSEEIAGDDPDFREAHGEDSEPGWHHQWIPWAQSDGDAQVIDMRDGPHQGRVGTAPHDDTGSFDNGWPSLAAYLHDVAEALDCGGEVHQLAPFLTTDPKLWWSCPGETELNGEPLTPAPTLRP